MATKKDESPIEQELTGKVSFTDTVGSMPNPDVILRKSGISTSVYSEMLYDPQIFSAFQKRKRKVQQLSYVIEGEDEEIVKFIKEEISGLNMSTLLSGMLKALPYGYSIAELIWEDINGKWTITDVLNRGNDRFYFSNKGNLVYMQNYTSEGIVAPYGKFLLHRNDFDDTDNPYGTSLNSRCYWYWRFKKHGWRVWGLYLEKYGDPALVLKTTEQDQEKIKALLDKLDSVASGSNIIIGGEEELTSLSATGASTVGYSDFVKDADKQISKVYLGSSVLMDETVNGNYATAQEHGSDLDDIIMSDADAISNTIRFCIIEPLVRFNFGENRELPFIKFFKSEVADNQTQGIVKTLKDEDNIDTSKGKEEINKDEGKSSTDGVSDHFLLSELDEEECYALPKHKQTIENLSFNLAVKQGAIFNRFLSFKGNSNNPDYAILEMSKYFNDMADALSVDIGYALFYIDMYSRMTTPIYKEQFSTEKHTSTSIENGTILPYEEARELFSSKVPLSNFEFKKLVNIAKQNSFSIADIKSTKILSLIQDSLSQSLLDGTGEKEWKVIGERILSSIGVSPFSKSHLANVYRTNLYSAYSKAGYQQWKEVESEFPAFMYDAVGDSRTRPSHLALDGKIFYADDPFWKSHYPPNGYNCRCSVIPMSKKKLINKKISNGEDYSGSDFAPDDGWNYHGGEDFLPLVDRLPFDKLNKGISWEDYNLPKTLTSELDTKWKHPTDKSGNKITKSDTILKTKIGEDILLKKGKYPLGTESINKIIKSPNEVWQRSGVDAKGNLLAEKTYIKSIKDADGKSVDYIVKVDKNGAVYDVKRGVNTDRNGVLVYPEHIPNKLPFSSVIDNYAVPLDEFTSSSSWDIRDIYYGKAVDNPDAQWFADEMEDMFKESYGDNNKRILYRGLRFDDEISRDSILEEISAIGEVVDKAPASSSTVKDIAIKFAGKSSSVKGIVLEIDGVSTSGYDISKYGVSEEAEVLIKPMTKLIYKGTTEQDTYFLVKLREE